ncbi:hypothetical protein TNCV_3726041 [Trichonephila clavipes]|nr:hypothetical protein TNCV_3726041 [Trichonephila clavipes]
MNGQDKDFNWLPRRFKQMDIGKCQELVQLGMKEFKFNKDKIRDSRRKFACSFAFILPRRGRNLHTFRILRPHYHAPNMRIRLTPPLVWVTILPKANNIAIFAD